MVLLLILGILIFIQVKIYNKSSYHEITKNSAWEVYTNVGKLGEFLTYHNLRIFEKAGAKFLFNLYIPKENKETTELDLIMICRKGIIVFESKNYSGWIFGDEHSKMWMQTLPSGKGKSHKT